MAQNVSFNGNALQTTHIIVSDIDHGSTPDNTVNILKLAKTPRSTITSQLKQQKTILLSGTVVGSTIVDCDNQLDIFKGYLIGQNKNLDIDYNGTTRRYIATLNKNLVTRPNNLNWATFKADFICAQPYGTDTTATSLVSATGRTAASYSDTVTFGGDAEWQTPVITVTVTAMTGGTNANIQIGNSATGQLLTVTRTWTNGDVLVVDSSSITNPVSVNGTPVVATGALPTFNVGSQTVTYNDSFATRTINYSVQNYNLWE